MKRFRKWAAFLLGAAAIAALVLFLAAPASEQTVINQSGPIIVLGTNLDGNHAYIWQVGVQPLHQYATVLIARTNGLPNVWNNVPSAVAWSPDPVGTSGMSFTNVTNYLHLFDSSSTIIGPCITTNVSLSSGQFEECVLASVPARTIQFKAAVLGSGLAYTLELIDLTEQGGQVFTQAPANSSQAVAGSNISTTPVLTAIGGVNNSQILQTIRTDSGGDLNTATYAAADHEALSGFTPQTLDPGGGPGLVALGALQSLIPGDAGSSINWKRGISNFQAAAATSSGNTAVWTPAAGRKFRLMCVGIDVTSNAAQSTGGVFTIKLEDGSTVIPGMLWSVFVPSTAGTAAGEALEVPVACYANGFLSSTANNVLNVNLSAALTAGSVTVRAYGTDE
jgi:hypothetical protein